MKKFKHIIFVTAPKLSDEQKRLLETDTSCRDSDNFR